MKIKHQIMLGMLVGVPFGILVAPTVRNWVPSNGCRLREGYSVAIVLKETGFNPEVECRYAPLGEGVSR